MARLFAKNNRIEDALGELKSLINNRDVSRENRWLAVYFVAEIIGENTEMRQKFETELTADSEMKNAVAGLSLVRNGKSADAQNFINEVEIENFSPNYVFEKAQINKAENQNDLALKDIIAVNILERDFYSSYYETTIWQELILRFSKNNQPFAVLKIAEKHPQTSMNMLDILSNSAEMVGDFAKAIEFETAKDKSEKRHSERSQIEQKIENLRLLENEKSKQATAFRVTEKLISND